MKHTVSISVSVDGEEYTSGFYVDPDLNGKDEDSFDSKEFLKHLKMILMAVYRQTPKRINKKEGKEYFTHEDIEFALYGKPFKLVVTEKGEEWYKSQIQEKQV